MTTTYELYRGDCLEIMQELPDNSIDLILCDLPYGTTANKWDSVIPFDDLWTNYNRLCKGAIVLTSSQPFTSALVMSNIKMFRYSWVWEKSNATGHLNAKRMPMKLHEDVNVFSAKPAPYNPQGLVAYGKTTKRGSNGGNFGVSGTENFQEYTNYPRSILRFDNESKAVHPTQKPVALMEYLIKTYTDAQDTVLDNTMGSGTTGVACGNTGRSFIGIEMDREYYHIARKRIAKAYKEAP